MNSTEADRELIQKLIDENKQLRKMIDQRNWITTREMAGELGISVKTLTFYRDNGEFWTKGHHYRRSSPAKQAPWQWHLERTVAAWKENRAVSSL